MSLMFLWCSRMPSSVRKTTAEAKGLCDILIWSVMSDEQHDVGYVRFGFTEKSYGYQEDHGTWRVLDGEQKGR